MSLWSVTLCNKSLVHLIYNEQLLLSMIIARVDRLKLLNESNLNDTQRAIIYMSINYDIMNHNLNHIRDIDHIRHTMVSQVVLIYKNADENVIHLYLRRRGIFSLDNCYFINLFICFIVFIIFNLSFKIEIAVYKDVTLILSFIGLLCVPVLMTIILNGLFGIRYSMFVRKVKET